MLPPNFSALLRWVSAQDPINTLVISCDNLPTLKVAKKDALLVWQGCLGDSFNTDLAAQLVASEIQTLEIVGCAQCASNLDQLVQVAKTRLGKLVANYHLPKKAARHPREVRLDSVPLPRRLLLPVSNGSPLDLGASHAVRTFQAYHLLAKQQRIENRVASPHETETGKPSGTSAAESCVTSETTEDFLPLLERVDAIHILRCNACHFQMQDCPENDEISLSEAGSHWHQLCPACRLAVRYCPEHSDSEIASQRSLEVFTTLKNQQSTQDMRECKRCRNPHPASEGELCALCNYQEKHPFSAAMPQEVLETLPQELQDKLRGV